MAQAMQPGMGDAPLGSLSGEPFTPQNERDGQLDEQGGAAVAFELDLKKRPIEPQFSGDARRVTGLAHQEPTGTRKKAPTVDPIDARLLAGFGVAPTKWWDTPKYASAVKARSAELEAIIVGKREAAARAEQDYDVSMMRLAARGVVAAAAASRAARAPYERTIEHLRASEAELRRHEGARAAETAALMDRLAAIDKRAAEFRKELDLALGALRRQGDHVTPDVRKRVDDAKEKLVIATEGRDEATRQLDASTATLSPEAQGARKDFVLVCSDFSRFVQDDMITFGPEFDEARGEIIRLTAAVEVADKDLALHLAALRTYDAAAVQRGKSVVMGGVIFVGLLLAAVILRVVM